MGDRLVFEIDLKDMMSRGLMKLAGIGQTAFAKIEAAEKRMETAMTGSGRAGAKGMAELASEVRNVGTEADKTAEKIRKVGDAAERAGKRGGGGTGGGWKSMMYGGLAARGLEMAGRGAMDVGRDALGNGMDLERMKVGMETFVGKSKANDIVEQVLQQAIRTPYTTQQLLPIMSGLISTGQTPERANRDMMNLANAIAGTGGSDYMLELAGYHLKQAASKGSIDGRILKEFQGTASIPVDRILGDYMFPEEKDAEKRRKKGRAFMEDDDKTLSYETFTNALNRAGEAGGFFAGAMDRLSQTMSGKNSTIKDAWWNMTAKLAESQMGPMKRWQDMLIHSIEDVPKIVEKLTPAFDRVTNFIDATWPGVVGFFERAGNLLAPIGHLVTSDGVVKLTNSFMDLAGIIADGISPAFKGLAGAVEWILDAMPEDHELGHEKSKREERKLNKAFYDNRGKAKGEPDWGMELDQELQNDLVNYMGRIWGGKLQPWMNSAKNKAYYEHNKVFDLSENPAYGDAATGKVKPKGDADANDVSDSIVNGGPKVLHIHLAPGTVKQDIHVGSAADVLKLTKEEFMRLLLGSVASVRAAMG